MVINAIKALVHGIRIYNKRNRPGREGSPKEMISHLRRKNKQLLGKEAVA